MDRLLTGAEISELTGAKIGTKQRVILDKAGIRYVERADGRPALTMSAVNAVLTTDKELAASTQPNWAALDT